MKINLKIFVFIYNKFYITLSKIINTQKVQILIFKNSDKKIYNIV